VWKLLMGLTSVNADRREGNLERKKKEYRGKNYRYFRAK
jgi:hypothetical protein